jgi:hypothetical protein
MSYAAGALNAALRQKVKKLTVIIISDGGFTECGYKPAVATLKPINNVIASAQKWRIDKGYGEAIITTIGIENLVGWPSYPKPSDKMCQGWMRSIGTNGHGGYFFVHEKKK